MGGSGGAGPIYRPSPEDLKKVAQEMAKEFNPVLEKFLDDSLKKINSRDTEEMNTRRDELLEALGSEFETVSLLYGGSVSKHTYVEGLSDVDALVVLEGDSDAENSPNEIKEILMREVSGLVDDATCRVGNVAVTLEYKDGMELQLIPSIRQEGVLKVPSWTGETWSRINPEKFDRALSKSNEKNGMKVVPVIKLAKAVLAASPLGKEISGYHVESMAIEAFKNYEGPKTVANMLPKFFERAATIVKSPIKDRSGQSVNVDTYLGRAGSKERKQLSHVLEGVSRRMTSASSLQSPDEWHKLLRKLDE